MAKCTSNDSISLCGTCYLVGVSKVDENVEDASFDVYTDDDVCSAGLELVNSHPAGGKENLRAKIIYSSLKSFEITFDENVFCRISYEKASADEVAKINMAGMTDFFELKFVLIKDAVIISEIRSFASRMQAMVRLTNRQIKPDSFYSSKKLKESLDATCFESFPRQELAFRHFDSILPEKASVSNPVKLFTFESLVSGKRQFLVADMKSFISNYLRIERGKRHVYEIIRENYPCRLYFDLEFSIPANPGLNGMTLLRFVWYNLLYLMRQWPGQDLVDHWIHIVTWKLYEIFGITVGSENFVDLDSTNADKFSRHITVIIIEPSRNSWFIQEKLSRSEGSFSRALPPFMGQELLFRNNVEVGYFVDKIVADVLLTCHDAKHELDNSGVCYSVVITVHIYISAHIGFCMCLDCCTSGSTSTIPFE